MTTITTYISIAALLACAGAQGAAPSQVRPDQVAAVAGGCAYSIAVRRDLFDTVFPLFAD